MEDRVVGNSRSESRMVWLVVGVLVGLCLSYFWPHEPAMAETNDRNSKFAIATSSVMFGNGLEGVFVLDFLTGQLTGAVMSDRLGIFTHIYRRNIGADFNVDRNKRPTYAIVSGKCPLPNRGGLQMSNSVIYVAELTSGQVRAYGFPYKISNAPLPPMTILELDRFIFREPAKE